MWNCRSIVNKLDNFQSFVYSTSLNIIALSETWLTDNVFDNEILPTNYTVYRSDRGSRGGGVMLCISSHIPSRLLQSHTTIDMVSVEVQTFPSIVFCCVYIPPKFTDDYLYLVLHSIESLSLQYSRLIVVGDFNAPDVEWSTLSASSHSSKLLCDVIFRCNLTQLITVPTHIHGNTLDLLFTNIDNYICNISTTINTTLLSDHYIIPVSYTHLTLPTKRIV